MKRLTPVLLLFVCPFLAAEEVTIKQPAVLKSGRNLVSLKPGAVVELVSREGNDITIKYKDLTGKIPASKLEESSEPPPPVKSDAPAPKPASAAKSKPPKKPDNKLPQSKGDKKLVENPQTGYGKAVKKAKDNAAAHDRNVVRPTDEVLKDN